MDRDDDTWGNAHWYEEAAQYDEGLWRTIVEGMITPAKMNPPSQPLHDAHVWTRIYHLDEPHIPF